MNDETKRRLLDALEACRAIRRFSAGTDYQSFVGNELLRAAVERKFEILGEALNALNKLIQSLRTNYQNCAG